MSTAVIATRLEMEEAAALAARAEAENVTRAELIRRAVAELLHGAERGRG